MSQENNSIPATGDKNSHILRTLSVLEHITMAERPVTPTEINKVLKLPKASIHRICTMLEQSNFLQKQLDGKKYAPGKRIRKMSVGVMSNENTKIVRKVILQKLSDDIGETCNISIPQGNCMQYFERAETHWPLRMQFPVGSQVPLHCTAGGKLFLSSLAEKERNNLIAILPLERQTDNTIVEIKDLQNEINKIIIDKVGIDDREFFDDMVCVAVPITDPKNRMFATLSFHAPVSRMSLEEAKTHISRLRQAAVDLSIEF